VPNSKLHTENPQTLHATAQIPGNLVPGICAPVNVNTLL